MKSIAIVVLLALSLVASGQEPESKPAYPALGRMVDIGGYRLHLNCTGKTGPAVILIAGGGDFSFDWELVQPQIAGFTRVCSYDRAGMAWSDPGPTPRTMRQDAYELHNLLRAAAIEPPYVLVGHSIGGLIARVYAEQYPAEVGGIVLVDPTHEDTTLLYQGKLVRVRDNAKGLVIPAGQTMSSSPPKAATKEDIDQFEFNLKMFGPPKIGPPFDKLSKDTQAIRLWFLSQPPRAAAGPDLWAEELHAMHTARAKVPFQLAKTILVVILPTPESGPPPNGISAGDWRRVNDEKRTQKTGLTGLSRNSKLVVAKESGHHLQLEGPRAVTDVVQYVVAFVKMGGLR